MTLPDFLADETESVILTRMLARLPEDLDKSEGSYLWDALSASAGEFRQLKIEMSEFLSRGFASMTFGEYLDMRCEEKGIPRNTAEKATGKVTFTGVYRISIPSGTRVATPADPTLNIPSVEFVTVGLATIPVEGVVEVNIEAVVAGTGGNVLADKITVLSQPISGVSAINNDDDTEGGVNIENDTSLLIRYLQKVQNPGTSGNKSDYKTWAMEISGVGDVVVDPLWNGRGTVKLFLLGLDKKPAVVDIVNEVQEYIDPVASSGEGDGKAPVGATVTASAATGININITATVALSGKTLAETQAAFILAIDGYLKSLAFATLISPDVKYVKVGSILLDIVGVQDYTSLLVNTGTANIPIDKASGEVAIRGTVTLSE